MKGYSESYTHLVFWCFHWDLEQLVLRRVCIAKEKLLDSFRRGTVLVLLPIGTGLLHLNGKPCTVSKLNGSQRYSRVSLF